MSFSKCALFLKGKRNKKFHTTRFPRKIFKGLYQKYERRKRIISHSGHSIKEKKTARNKNFFDIRFAIKIEESIIQDFQNLSTDMINLANHQYIDRMLSEI